MPRRVRPYTVMPFLPKPIAALRDVAYNLWWTWAQDARELFVRVDQQLWDSSGHNPVAMLGRIGQERLEQVAEDDGFLAHLERVKHDLDAYMTAKTWYDHQAEGKKRTSIAYFSAEFGIHECMPIYSGGLGVLAGDHLKSASGLGLPLVGVGLAYYNGYCRQYLNADGWQQEFLQFNDFYNLAATLERDKNGQPILVALEFPGREVKVQIWRVQVGRVPLFLLDTRIEANRPEDRGITDQLYGGDHEHRIQQELVLGVGGYRALRALGREPEVCHMNEGHSAFLALERMRILIQEKGLSFDQAREAVTAGNVFTTHTPVPAGIDRFGPDQIDRYFGSWHGQLRCDRRVFLALGRQHPHDEGEPFNMAVLALKTAACANGVSKLHATVSRGMWQQNWPEVPLNEIPIAAITNGVHIRSYVSDQLNELFMRYAGTRWSYDAAEPHKPWRGPDLVPDSEIWRVHERRRARLVTWARQRLHDQLERRGAGPRDLAAAEEVLDPEALTIGFARRFATYKRGTLLFRDPERLAQLLNDPLHPVQIVFAGKAHPQDNAGKQFIQAIAQMGRDERFRKRIVFLEDYDINLARYLVQGVDVWLNTPRRPHEASGTSGMKAAANGALNCSILDGWWCEGYDGTNGFAIGRGEEYADAEYQDQVESRALYDLLENQVVPIFYQRGNDRLPREWIKRMKRAMQTCIPVFSTLRMVREYAERFYIPTGERWQRMNADSAREAKELWDWKMGLFQRWAQLRVEEVESQNSEHIPVGHSLTVSARVHLGPVPAEQVDVQIYYGALNDHGEIDDGEALSMRRDTKTNCGEGCSWYRAAVPCRESGRFGFAVRILPKHDGLVTPFIPGLITWG
jgi:glycogen phosphorylase